MEDKVKGSWLIHHTNKLQNITNQGKYQKSFLAGKSGILLSAISESSQSVVSNEKLEVLANAANINTTFELPKLLDVLQEHQLIDKSASGVGVLGVTTVTTLQHTSNIFESLDPNNIENSVIELAEIASEKPIQSTLLAERISDIYQLSGNEINSVIFDSEQIGFVDVENISKSEKILFNGNLFRRESAQKIKYVLDSLTQSEQLSLNELSATLKKIACVPVAEAQKILGMKLFEKVAAIGFVDVSVVSNNKEEVGYVTLPSAFSKYSSSMVEDAFDLAKAFVASLTYGMTKSSYMRGQITMIDRLLSALISGREVGPVSAIGQDYKVLELKGVVSVRQGSKNGRSGPMMKLLKIEVGELALQAIRQGDISEHSVPSLPGVNTTPNPQLFAEYLKQQEFP
jgi:hypothetical protein